MHLNAFKYNNAIDKIEIADICFNSMLSKCKSFLKIAAILFLTTVTFSQHH